jgi:hypothetical protein
MTATQQQPENTPSVVATTKPKQAKATKPKPENKGIVPQIIDLTESLTPEEKTQLKEKQLAETREAILSYTDIAVESIDKIQKGSRRFRLIENLLPVFVQYHYNYTPQQAAQKAIEAADAAIVLLDSEPATTEPTA